MTRRTLGSITQLAILAVLGVISGALTLEGYRALRGHREATERAGRAFVNVSTREMRDLTTTMLDHQVATIFLLASRLPPQATEDVATAFQRIVTQPARPPCDWPCLPGPGVGVLIVDLQTGRSITAPGHPLDSALSRWMRDTIATDVATEYQPLWQASYLRAPASVASDRALIHRVTYDAVGRPRLSMAFLIDYRAYGRALVRRATQLSAVPPGGRAGGYAMRIQDDVGGKWLDISATNPPAVHTSTWVNDPFFGRYRVDYGLSENVLDALAGSPPINIARLLTLFALTVVLILVAAWQWLRERHLITLREAFLSDVSHDLRTPLAEVRLFSELLAYDKLETGEQRAQAARIIGAETDRVAQMLSNLLTMARADRRKLELRLTPVSLREIVCPRLAALSQIAAQAGMQLEAGEITDTVVLADPNALAQILDNLVENAIRHARSGGSVYISAVPTNGAVRLMVEDRGPGIAPVDRRRIWRRFVRLRTADAAPGTTPPPGTGIGLAVVSQLARLQRARVWVEDAIPRGARFVVELTPA